MLKGAADHSKYEEMLGQAQIREEQTKIADIERKHLQGLLSREEAILARQAVLENKRMKKEQFDLEVLIRHFMFMWTKSCYITKYEVPI